MNSLSLKKDPPRYIESAVEWLLPYGDEVLLSELKEYSQSPTDYSWKAAQLIFVKVWTNARRAFSLERALLEASALSVPFLWTPVWPAVAAVAPVVVAFRIREGFIYPGRGTPGETATDILVGTATMLLSQLVLWLALPSLLLPQTVLTRGIAGGVFLDCLLRAYFHLKTPSYDADLADGSQSVHDAFRMNILWAGMCLALAFVGVQAVPDSGWIRDRVLGAGVLALFGVSRALEGNPLFRFLWEDKKQELNLCTETDQVIKELLAKKGTLWQTTDNSRAQFCEAAFFLLLGFSLPVAIWRWFHGTGADTDWPSVVSSVTGLLLMTALWGQIKRINREAALAIDEAIQRRRDDLTESEYEPLISD